MSSNAFILAVALFFISPPALALDSQSDLHHLGYQTWRTENGLPQNTVHSILQTRAGYIWLATEGGVVRFDGVRFVIYDRQNTPELKSNNIRSLAEGRDGALWIASADGLVRFAASSGWKIRTGKIRRENPGENPDGGSKLLLGI